MSEWKKVSLSEMGIVSRGKSKHRPRNDARLYGGRYPFIQTGDIGAAGLYVTDYSQTYNEEGLAQSKLWEVNTLCITIAANIADTALLAFPACFPDSIMGFVPYKNVANVKYVKYCFDILKKDCQQISQGTAQDNLSWKKLSTIKFPCPPLEVQNRIATILSRYDSLIENYQKQIKLLEEAAQRLYKEWFVDLHFPGHENIKIIDGVPEGWEKKPVDTIYSIKYGKNLSTKLISENGKFPVYGANGVIGYYDKANCNEQVVLITSRGNGSGDVLMTYHKDAFITNNSFIVSPIEDYSYCQLPFTYQFLKNANFRAVRTGAAQPQLTNQSIYTVDVVLPSKDVIIDYCDKASYNNKKIILLKNQIRLLTEARDRLLPKLMSGEIELEGGERPERPTSS